MAEFTIYLWPFTVILAVAVALWPLSLWLRDASVIDGWWGPGFLAQALAAALASSGGLGTREWLLIGLIGIWSLRLGWLLIERRLRAGDEDPRYTAIRRSWDPGFWWKSLFVVFVLQALIQFAIALGPITAIVNGPSDAGALAWLGAAIAVAGLALEVIADRQLNEFKRAHPEGTLCTTGLRAHLRHPNYLGEIIFWVGIGLIVIEAGAWLVGLLSPALVIFFITSVSGAPMLDEHLSASKPGYDEYRARVPGFIPGLRRRRVTRA